MHLARALPLRPARPSRPLRSLLTFLSLSLVCLAQTKATDPRAGYQKAMEEKQTNSRILALENWQAQAGAGAPPGDAFGGVGGGFKQIGNQGKGSTGGQKMVDGC